MAVGPSGSRSDLTRECRNFAWALIGDPPTDDVIAAYERAHERSPLDQPGSPIDRALVAVGRRHPWLARLADAYSALFVRKGLFRTKLIVLLALLESSAPHHWRFEHETTSPVAAWTRLTLAGLAASLAALFGVLLFAPVHLAVGLFGSRPGRATDPVS